MVINDPSLSYKDHTNTQQEEAADNNPTPAGNKTGHLKSTGQIPAANSYMPRSQSTMEHQQSQLIMSAPNKLTVSTQK